MRVAMVGLPASGKSTLFAAVTGKSIDPYAAPQLYRASVKVPDVRLDYLGKLCQPKKTTEATIEFVDIPGGGSGADSSDGLRRSLPEVRQCDALVAVIRDHANPDVPAYKNRVDAPADLREVWDELIFADLDAVTTRIERLDKSLKKPTKTHEIEQRELTLLLRCQTALEDSQPLLTVLTTDDERRLVSSFAFLTLLPLIVVRNVDESRIANSNGLESDHAVLTLSLCATAELDIAELEPEDRAAFLAELNIEVPARDRLIQSCYKALGLISFLTMGPDEVRAWPIVAGSTAVKAAGTIHSDLARGFIRAETVAYDDLVTHSDFRGAKAAGRVRQEGKTYVIEDGDVLNIRFNV